MNYKKYLSAILITTFLLISYFKGMAQMYAPDFSLTNTSGVTYNLYEQLNSGKVVVLDFFSISCLTCQEGIPFLDSIYQAHNSGEGALTVWGIESQEGTEEEIIQFMIDYGGTFNGFATIGHEEILAEDMYDITYTPQYVVVCTDGMMKKVPKSNIIPVINHCFTSSLPTIYETATPEVKIFTTLSEISISHNFSENEKIQVELFDILGRKHFQGEFSGTNEIVIERKNLPAGIYFIRLQDSNKNIASEKFQL